MSGLKKLRVLRFHGATVSDAGVALIKDLTELEDLQLGLAPVSDAALETIGTLGKLKTLNCKNTASPTRAWPGSSRLSSSGCV